MHYVSLARRSIDKIRRDFEAFDLMVEGGLFQRARRSFVRVRRHRSAWSVASFAGFATTAAFASLVLLTSSAV